MRSVRDDTSEFSSRAFNPLKVEVSKHPNGLMSAACIPREENVLLCIFLPNSGRERITFLSLYLFCSHGGLERVVVLPSIADVREPVDVRYEGQPGRHLLALS